jgi:Fic family protein
MSHDDAHGGPPGTVQADRLYRGFPDFSAWGPLSPEDADLWSRFAASLAERRQAATPDALKNAVEVAIRAAALDTGAIEGLYNVDRGFTMTVAVQGLAWQQMVEERGAGVRELFEAQLAAYELVLDAVTHKMPITEAWIRSLHETLCAPQKTYRVLTDQGWQEQELPKGRYKSRPNHVRLTDGTFHAYAPVDLVSMEMHRLVEQIRTPEFEEAHPVLQASYCHYAFVVIHPFADGNGRVARALASTFFYRAQSIPLVIFANQRPAYLDSLGAADLGDFGPVILFFQDRGIDTMQLVSESLITAASPSLEDLALRLIHTGEDTGLEIENILLRIAKEIDEQVLSQAQELTPYHLTLRKTEPFASSTVSMVRFLPEFSQAVGYALQKNSNTVFHTILVHFLGKSRFPFIISSREHPNSLELRLEDVSPELTAQFHLRLAHWAQRQLRLMLSDLDRQSDDMDVS